MTDFALTAGDSRIINVTATTEAGTPIDLTGATIVWKAASVPFGTAVISKVGVITTPPGTDGKFKVTLAPADTAGLVGNLYHSAELTLADSSVSTIYLGLISITPLSNAISVEMFKARYPEFAPVSDALISLVLTESLDSIGDTWLQKDRTKAQMLLAAHKLASEGEPARSSGNGGGGSTSGAVKRLKVGDVEVEYAGLTGTSGSGAASGFSTTVYGQQYLALLRLNFDGPIAV